MLIEYVTVANGISEDGNSDGLIASYVATDELTAGITVPTINSSVGL